MTLRLLLLIHTILFTINVNGQDSLGIVKYKKSFLREDQHFYFNLPIYVPNFTGQYALGEASLEPDDDASIPDDGNGGDPGGGGNPFEKFFKKQFNLEFFFIGQLGYENKDFFIRSDAYMGNIGGSFRWRDTNTEIAQVSLKSFLGRCISGYKVYHYISPKKTFKMSIDPYWGIRAQSFRIRSSTHSKIINDFQILSPLTIEPLLGIRVPLILRRWYITTMFDVGGFSIKERWSYMLNIFAAYKFNKFMAIRFGWTEYQLNKKVLFDKLKYSVHLRGPTMGLSFQF